ncbi:hypothetical protein SAMN02927903_03115 [Flavobacterium caeni]|uniref:Uncharacterized protein n=1 Tax=Flavobacterium caeni TaxID=490189 RepID=A0A1G5K8C9_9FLAO|nr:hypothetical protein SAMN02927903_03115 [Flavobacterium caeni]
MPKFNSDFSIYSFLIAVSSRYSIIISQITTMLEFGETQIIGSFTR